VCEIVRSEQEKDASLEIDAISLRALRACTSVAFLLRSVGQEARSPMSQVTRILVPTDFSVASDLATDYAIDMAFRYGASIRLVHVLEDLYLAGYPDGFVDLSGLQKRQEEDAAKALAARITKCEAARLEASSDMFTGRAATVICDEALRSGADMIIMGTHGRTGLAHMFLGSVAERVVRLAPCPVLTVRENARVQAALAADAAARLAPLPILAAR
jgi:universal stress protein A